MKQQTLKKFYEIHSWVGVVTAILMFVIAFTGAVAVFGAPELKVWSHPFIHQSPSVEPKRIERLLREYLEILPEPYQEQIDVIMPASRRSEYLLFQFVAEIENENGRGHQHFMRRFYHDPHTLELVSEFDGTEEELIASSPKDMADFIIEFHADLHLGNPWGLMLTGLLGLTLFSSIVSGVLIHRKILKELFVFRPRRSLRLLWNDSHKVLGVWGILFHFAIAFTGSFLGLAAVILVPAAAFVSFGGDQEALVATVLPEIKPDLTGVKEQLYIADVLTKFQNSEKGAIVSASIVGGTDTNALAVINSLAGDGLEPETIQFHAKSAELLRRDTTYSRIGGFSGPVLDALRPLHFGDFGGTGVKLLWAVLGVGTALLALSGMMIWVERRAYGPTGALSEHTYLRISRITVGSCVGLVVAISSLFYAQRLLLSPPEDMGFHLGIVFFSSWLSAVAWGVSRSNEYIASRHLFFVSGVLLLLLPVCNGLWTGNHLFNVFGKGHYQVAGVDFGLLTIGLLLLWLSKRIPKRRSESKYKRQDDKVNLHDAQNLVN